MLGSFYSAALYLDICIDASATEKQCSRSDLQHWSSAWMRRGVPSFNLNPAHCYSDSSIELGWVATDL